MVLGVFFEVLGEKKSRKRIPLLHVLMKGLLSLHFDAPE